jgi:multiple sugar transport system permease protein
MKIYLFLIPLILYLGIFLIYPLVYNILLSLNNVNLINYATNTYTFSGFDNYINIIKDPNFWLSFENTIIFLILSLVFQFTIGFILALVFYKPFKLRNILQTLVMIPWFIPTMASMSFFKWSFGDTGLFNSILMSIGTIHEHIPWLTSTNLPIYATIIANIWLGIPFNYILLYTGLQTIPSELFDSARVDGANWFQTLLYVTIPTLRSTIIVILMLGTIFTVKAFDPIWIITGGGPANSSQTFSTLSYSYAFQNGNFGLSSTIIIFMLVFVAILITFFEFLNIRGDKK